MPSLYAALIPAFLLTSCQIVTVPAPTMANPRDEEKTSAQVLLGIGSHHKLTFRREDPSGPGNSVGVDLDIMPSIGVASFYQLGGRRVPFGLEGGLLYSWRDDTSRQPALSAGTLHHERSLTTFEGFLGPAITGYVGRVRGFAGAGVSVIQGRAYYEDETFDEYDSTLGLGGYVRAGVEYRLEDRSLLGLSLRWVANDLDFGGRIGSMDVEGWQLFLTYTLGL